MECKFFMIILNHIREVSVDLTRMECKLTLPRRESPKGICVDLTRMECKYRNQTANKEHHECRFNQNGM